MGPCWQRERRGSWVEAGRWARFVSEGEHAVRWARARRRASERAAGTGRPSGLWAGSGAGCLLSGVRDTVACGPNGRRGEELGRALLVGREGKEKGFAGWVGVGFGFEEKGSGPAGWASNWVWVWFLPLFFFLIQTKLILFEIKFKFEFNTNTQTNKRDAPA